jgi:DNA-binding response OmpR family regulator
MQSIGQAGRVVLIVEDEPVTTRDLETALRAVGAAVLRSSKPAAALEATQAHHVAAAVLVACDRRR